MGLLDKDGIVQVNAMHKKDKESSDEESEESSSEEEKVVSRKVTKKKVDKSAFRVNTSYCRSELELL